MKKILVIGECIADVIFVDNVPQGFRVGGRLPNAATILSKKGLPVNFAGEASTDHVGNFVVDFFKRNSLGITSIDRVTEGITPTQLIFNSSKEEGTEEKEPQIVRYEEYPPECFDVVWPRIDPDDIIVYGGYYALDPRRRTRLLQLLAYCQERGAIMVYLPGFLPQRAPSTTKIMPALLENLEMANMVISRTSDISNIFKTMDDAQCYHRHIDFYCPAFINIDTVSSAVNFFHYKDKWSLKIDHTSATMHWNAGFIAGIVEFLYNNCENREQLEKIPSEQAMEMLQSGVKEGDIQVSKYASEPWQLLN